MVTSDVLQKTIHKLYECINLLNLHLKEISQGSFPFDDDFNAYKESLITKICLHCKVTRNDIVFKRNRDTIKMYAKYLFRLFIYEYTQNYKIVAYHSNIKLSHVPGMLKTVNNLMETNKEFKRLYLLILNDFQNEKVE